MKTKPSMSDCQSIHLLINHFTSNKKHCTKAFHKVFLSKLPLTNVYGHLYFQEKPGLLLLLLTCYGCELQLTLSKLNNLAFSTVTKVLILQIF